MECLHGMQLPFWLLQVLDNKLETKFECAPENVVVVCFLNRRSIQTGTKGVVKKRDGVLANERKYHVARPGVM